MAIHDQPKTETVPDRSPGRTCLSRAVVRVPAFTVGIAAAGLVLLILLAWLSTRVPGVAPEDLLLLEPSSVAKVEAAAAGGNLRAQATLGTAYLLGREVVEKNVTKAVYWLRKVADRDAKEFDRMDSRMLAVYDERRRETSPRKQRELDLEYLDLVLTKLAYEQAFIGLASVYAGAYGAGYADSADALKYLRRGAACGFPSAQRILGLVHLYGWLGVPRDELVGRRWLLVAAVGGDPVAVDWLNQRDALQKPRRFGSVVG